MKNFINKHIDILSIICFVVGIIFFAINLFGKFDMSILTTIGCMFTTIGIILFINNDPVHNRGFEFVSSNMRKNVYAKLPIRSSINSAGYDFFADKDYKIEPNEIVKIWTDVKAYMQSDEFLMLDVRSSMGGKFMLANTIGIIDSDYYENSDNDGNIGIFLKNISEKTQYISKNDKIAQGIFMEYLKIDNDKTIAKRKGGFGSTDK